MTQTTDVVLNRIALALERTPDFPFAETAVGAGTIAVIGTLLGAYLHHRSEIIRVEKEEERQRKQQRQLLVSILGDEIALRWHPHISKDFLEVLQNFNMDNVDALCNTKFQPGDLYIFKQCAENFSLTTTFEDNAVVSGIIYIHILSKDLSDELELLRESYKEHERLIASTAAANEIKTINSTLEIVWTEIKSTYEKMDAQMLTIFSRIEQEYGKFVDSCNKKDQIIVSDLIPRLENIASRRLCDPLKSDGAQQSKP